MKFIKLFEEYDNYITVYHGTQPKFVNSIKKNGLIDKTGYNQGWYMVSTDFESALFHAYTDTNIAYVIEFKIPIIKNKYWLGYPYLWKGEDMSSDNSIWFALKEKLSPNLISNIIEVNKKDWLIQKQNRF